MAKSVSTESVDPKIASQSVSIDLAISAESKKLPLMSTDVRPLTVKYKLLPESAKSVDLKLIRGMDVPIVNVEIIRDKTDVETHSVDLGGVSRPVTTAVEVDLQKGVETISIDCTPPGELKSKSSDIADRLPITRNMLDINYIPYPMISEFLQVLAEKNGRRYSEIKLIGVFDPVPIHLAEKLTLDSVMGVLKYRIRKTPVDTGGRRIVRVVYGKVRLTGEIVSAVFPVD